MRKTLTTIGNIVMWLVIIAAVCAMVFTITFVTTVGRLDRSVFGYNMFVVQSDSMSATDFSAGDMIFVKSVDPTTLKEGDIITFVSQSEMNYGETVTHKIRSLTTTESGAPGFVTYGTTTDTDDESIVTYGNIVGRYTGHVKGVGNFFVFFRTVPGYIVCIFVPFLILIAMFGVNCVKLFRRYKREQLEEIEEERKRLEAEHMKAEEMLKELRDLKVTITSKAEDANEPEPDPAPTV